MCNLFYHSGGHLRTSTRKTCIMCRVHWPLLTVTVTGHIKGLTGRSHYYLLVGTWHRWPGHHYHDWSITFRTVFRCGQTISVTTALLAESDKSNSPWWRVRLRRCADTRGELIDSSVTYLGDGDLAEINYTVLTKYRCFVNWSRECITGADRQLMTCICQVNMFRNNDLHGLITCSTARRQSRHGLSEPYTNLSGVINIRNNEPNTTF